MSGFVVELARAGGRAAVVCLACVVLVACGGGAGGDGASDGEQVDRTPPDTIITARPDGETSARTARFEFQATEEDSTFECSLDGGAWSVCSPPALYADLGEGAHLFQVRAVGRNGERDATPARAEWTVDLTPPQTRLISGPGSLSGSAQATFSFSASESGATFECALDGGPYAPCTTPATFAGLMDGNHLFHVRAIDRAGNVDPTPETYDWQVDLSFNGSVGRPFPIANSTDMEWGVSAAHDGTRWLVGLVSQDASGTKRVSVQLIGGDGMAVAPPLVVDGDLGNTGPYSFSNSIPRVAFGATDYLVLWGATKGGDDLDLYGQRVSLDGREVGPRITLSRKAGAQYFGLPHAAAFDGTNYLVVWDHFQMEPYAVGQLVSADGTLVGDEIPISTPLPARSSVVRFANGKYLVVWDRAGRVAGRFVGLDGTPLGDPFLIRAKQFSDQNSVGIAFDGNGYLVVWNEMSDASGREWDAYGQLLDGDGALVGDPIPIATEAGGQIWPTVAFDGANYLVVWSDISQDLDGDAICDEGEGSCIDVWGRYLDTTGTPLGNSFPIDRREGNQIGALAGFGNGRYLVLVGEGFRALANEYDFVSEDLSGRFVVP